MDIVVGTAGHIDHGKTALIKALTGVDADRLPEEKDRGITIDLGFAELDLGETRIGFVDVPGHERFVKNMLAGASGIDAVLLVVAADEGVMPQTREHFDICRLLNIGSGLVVLTKRDLVDDETLELARLDVAELVAGSFLQNARVITVSSKTGDGIDELKSALEQAAQTLTSRQDAHITRLPIDRSFTVKGFGAVVTGTLVSGEIREGEEMELMPDGRKVRVRGLQTHGKKVEAAHAGQRTALNLAGIDHTEIHRGMTLCERGILRSTQILDVEIEVLKSATNGIRSRGRVRVHIGTVEALARVSILNTSGVIAPGETGYAQLRLEAPIVAALGERFIIRSYSPQATIAGGRVIDPLAQKHPSKDHNRFRSYLTQLGNAGNDAELVKIIIEMGGKAGRTLADIAARTGLRRSDLIAAVEANMRNGSVVNTGDQYVEVSAFDKLKAEAFGVAADFHQRQPLAKGTSLGSIRERTFRHLPGAIFESVIKKLEADNEITVAGDVVRLTAHRAVLASHEKQVHDRLRKIYGDAGFEVPRLDDALNEAAKETGLTTQKVRTIFQLFLDSGEIVKVTDELYFAQEAIDDLVVLLKKFADGTLDRLVDMPRFKEMAGVSRKYAIPLIEYFDRSRITQRSGDKRIIL